MMNDDRLAEQQVACRPLLAEGLEPVGQQPVGACEQRRPDRLHQRVAVGKRCRIEEARCGLPDGQRRGETLSVEEFAVLSRAVDAARM